MTSGLSALALVITLVVRYYPKHPAANAAKVGGEKKKCQTFNADTGNPFIYRMMDDGIDMDELWDLGLNSAGQEFKES